MDNITIEIIAKFCHTMNREFCISIGDNSQLPWDEAPEWQKDSAVKGVEFALSDPNAKPEDSHATWLAGKIISGWKYGPIKNADLKEHPCIVPYPELPKEQQIKDELFLSIVNVFRPYVK